MKLGKIMIFHNLIKVLNFPKFLHRRYLGLKIVNTGGRDVSDTGLPTKDESILDT